MRKKFFFSIVAAIAVAMTFVSCGKKVAQNTEEPIAGTDYVVVTTPDGSKGIKKGDAFVVTPEHTYKNIEVGDGGLFLAETEGGLSLLDPDTGYECVSADTFTWKSFFYEGKRGDNFIVYIPVFKARFAAQTYLVKAIFAIAIFNGKTSVYKEGKLQIEPTDEYAKIAVLPDGSLLVQEGKTWGTATIKDNAIVPGKVVTPKDLKKYKTMKGWDETSPIMILE